MKKLHHSGIRTRDFRQRVKGEKLIIFHKKQASTQYTTMS